MDALRKPRDAGKLFVAAELWAQNAETTQEYALFLGYGVLYENGDDLSVHV